MAVAYGFILPLALTSVLLACLAAVATTLVRRRRNERRHQRIIDELERSLELAAPGDRAVELAGPGELSFERIVADLRRLNRLRAGVATRSHLWRRAILAAYDDSLRAACRCLGVVEYLSGLDGADRALERIRVEDELRAAGMDLPVAPPPVSDWRR